MCSELYCSQVSYCFGVFCNYLKCLKERNLLFLFCFAAVAATTSFVFRFFFFVNFCLCLYGFELSSKLKTRLHATIQRSIKQSHTFTFLLLPKHINKKNTLKNSYYDNFAAQVKIYNQVLLLRFLVNSECRKRAALCQSVNGNVCMYFNSF